MQRKDLLTKEEIIDAFRYNTCEDCIVDKEWCKAQDDEMCTRIKITWLEKETELKPKIEGINTEEELEKELEDFKNICNSHSCAGCDIGIESGGTTADCFAKWLCKKTYC